MITGKPPYGGETQQQTLRHAANTETAEAFASFTEAGADADLLAIARRALAANRDYRYRHAGEMADAVTAYRESLAERLRQAELAREKALVKAAEERRRRRVVISLAAAVMAIVLGAVAVWGWSERLAAQKASRAATLNGQIRTALDAADTERRRTAEGVGRSRKRHARYSMI